MMSVLNLFTNCVLAIVFISCNNSNPKQQIQDTLTSEIRPVENVKIADTTVLKNVIIDYYKEKFRKTKSEEPESVLRMENTEDGLELTVFSDTTSMFLSVNIIPYAEFNIIGDLNADGLNDIIIPVYSTGGGSSDWQENFLFISTNGKLDFFKMYTSRDLGICNSKGSKYGKFYPEKIENGKLIGETYSYLDGDAHCCPSIHCLTQFKFDNGLTFLNQTIIK